MTAPEWLVSLQAKHEYWNCAYIGCHTSDATYEEHRVHLAEVISTELRERLGSDVIQEIVAEHHSPDISPGIFEYKTAERALAAVTDELLGTRDPSPAEHIGGGANAEDCPACGPETPYPWICSGGSDG